MTIQEEIREGIVGVFDDGCVSDLIYFYKKYRKKDPDYYRSFLYSIARSILNKLHSQGVVIKVDRELPESSYPNWSNREMAAYLWSQADMLKAGCGFFEPLI